MSIVQVLAIRSFLHVITLSLPVLPVSIYREKFKHIILCRTDSYPEGMLLVKRMRRRGCSMRQWPLRLGNNSSPPQMGVGCRGFRATSTIRLLNKLEIHRQALHQTIKETPQRAQCCSKWLWIWRKTSSGPQDVRDKHPGLISQCPALEEAETPSDTKVQHYIHWWSPTCCWWLET